MLPCVVGASYVFPALNASIMSNKIVLQFISENIIFITITMTVTIKIDFGRSQQCHQPYLSTTIFLEIITISFMSVLSYYFEVHDMKCRN